MSDEKFEDFFDVNFPMSDGGDLEGAGEPTKEPQYKYRVSQTVDPEERLEDAAMAKAMHDAFEGDLVIVPDGEATFGRGRMFRGEFVKNIKYWEDPAFLNNAARPILLRDPDGAQAEIEKIHAEGKDAFVKATDLKLFAMPVRQGQTLFDAIDAYIFSVIDRGPCLMVQPFVEMQFEMRCVSIDREIVTFSPVATHLTPCSRLQSGELFLTPNSRHPSFMPGVEMDLVDLASKVAQECEEDNVIIDVAMVDGEPGVIEFNPFSIGSFGLYNCDPAKIAVAFRQHILDKGLEPAPALKF